MTAEQILRLAGVNTAPSENDVIEAFKDMTEWVDEVTNVLSNHGNSIKVIQKEIEANEKETDTRLSRREDQVDEHEDRIENIESRFDDLPDLFDIDFDDLVNKVNDNESDLTGAYLEIERLKDITSAQEKTISHLVATVNSLLNTTASFNNILAVLVPNSGQGMTQVSPYPLGVKWTCSSNTDTVKP